MRDSDTSPDASDEVPEMNLEDTTEKAKLHVGCRILFLLRLRGEVSQAFIRRDPRRVPGAPLAPFPRGKSNLTICEPVFAYHRM